MRLLSLTCLARVLAIVHGACSLAVDPAGAADLTPVVAGMTPALRVEAVTGTPGCVAFWDFVKREPGEPRRFVSHVLTGDGNDFPLDAGNYVRDFWGDRFCSCRESAFTAPRSTSRARRGR